MADIIIDSDSGKFKAGDDADLEIYNNGSHSYIANATASQSIVLRTRASGGSTADAVTIDADKNVTIEGNLTVNKAITFNETSAAADFRVESDDNTHMLFVDASEDKVGIGTDSPKNYLHVSDGSTSNLSLTDGIIITDASNPKLVFEDTGEGTDDKVIMFNHYDEALRIMSSNDDQSSWNKTAIAVFHRDGNVGIGTDSPSATDWGSAAPILQLSGTQPLLSLKDTDVTNGEWQIANSGQVLYFWSATTDKSIVFDADGRVGVGITSPDSTARMTVGTTTASDANGINLNRGTRPTISASQAAISCVTNGDTAGSGEAMYLQGAEFHFMDDDESTKRMVINSSGSVEFSGTAQETFQAKSSISSDAIFKFTKTTVNGGSANLKIQGYRNTSTSDTAILSFDNNTTTCGRIYMRRVDDNSGTLILGGGDSGTIQDTLYLLNTARVGIGESGPSTVCHIKGQNDAHAGVGVLLLQTAYASGTTRVIQTFYDDGGTHCGEISIHRTNHTAAYGTSSDYRLKENEIAISDGLTRLNQLKPYKFNFKSNPEKTKLDGFFAHEVSSIVPEAVVGEKDAMAVNPVTGEEEISKQQIDHSKLVPLLVAAVQELSAKVEALENA